MQIPSCQHQVEMTTTLTQNLQAFINISLLVRKNLKWWTKPAYRPVTYRLEGGRGSGLDCWVTWYTQPTFPHMRRRLGVVDALCLIKEILVTISYFYCCSFSVFYSSFAATVRPTVFSSSDDPPGFIFLMEILLSPSFLLNEKGFPSFSAFLFFLYIFLLIFQLFFNFTLNIRRVCFLMLLKIISFCGTTRSFNWLVGQIKRLSYENCPWGTSGKLMSYRNIFLNLPEALAYHFLTI